MKVYDLDTFVLVIVDGEHARTIGRLHPNYSSWRQKVNQPKQLGLLGLDCAQEEGREPPK